MVTNVAVDLKREFWWKVWIYNVLCLPLLLPWGEPACVSLSVREFQRARVSVLKRPCLWTQRTHVQVCKCLCACVCAHACVTASITVWGGPPWASPPILQHLTVWCRDLTLAVCLSPFSVKRPNPTRTLEKIAKPIPSKINERFYCFLFCFSAHTQPAQVNHPKDWDW